MQREGVVHTHWKRTRRQQRFLTGVNSLIYTLYLLPATNEVWGKVIFSEACISHLAKCGGDAWWGGGMCGKGGMHGRRACMARGACMVKGAMHGEGGACGSRGAYISGGHAWQWRHAWQMGGHAYKRDGHWSGRYASYWNAFLFSLMFCPGATFSRWPMNYR